MLLGFISIANTQICTYGCAQIFSDVIVGYGYSWEIGENEKCGSRPPSGGDVYFAVVIGSNNSNQNIVVDQGVYDSYNGATAC